MTNYRSLNHTKWECQYHVVFIPKYRRKALYGGVRRALGDVLRRLAEHRESRVEEGRLLADHVHMMVSIPPKYSVAQGIGYIKGKSAIHMAREFGGRPRNFMGQHFWARGYYVSTVGRDERVVRDYIQQQEREDRRLDQLQLDEGSHLSVAQVTAKRSRHAALSGSQAKAPGFAGGYLHGALPLFQTGPAAPNPAAVTRGGPCAPLRSGEATHVRGPALAQSTTGGIG